MVTLNANLKYPPSFSHCDTFPKVTFSRKSNGSFPQRPYTHKYLKFLTSQSNQGIKCGVEQITFSGALNQHLFFI